MNWFPQIGAGAVAQFPLRRKRQWRAITNVMESGELISLPDSTGGQIEWRLSYQELTDGEIATLTALFAASAGEAISFGFVDPFANLLGWSEDLSKSDWQAGLLTRTGGLSDPVGTERAWNLQNGGGAEQMLSQTLGVPGSYTVCFSVYVRSDSAGTIGILRDSARVNVPVGAQWKRIQTSGTGTSGALASTFALAIGAGSAVRVFGLQVEVQPWPSPYRPTGTASGILEDTRFSGGDLTVTSTAPGLSACLVNLVSRI
jgi:hypothetical protein